MEVKYQKSGNGLKLNIYIDENLWRAVKASYFERKMKALIDAVDFKEAFKKFEKQKAIDISLILLDKRSYLKKEWVEKMRQKMFPLDLIEEVFDEFLIPFFNEEDEVRSRIAVYFSKGKGMRWIESKMSPILSLSREYFQHLLRETFTEDKVDQKIQDIESMRSLLEKKGREKTIAFFLRRGFSYSQVAKALF